MKYKSDIEKMRVALQEASNALALDEVPIGALKTTEAVMEVDNHGHDHQRRQELPQPQKRNDCHGHCGL